MSPNFGQNTVEETPTIYCTQCGGAMRVAVQHVRTVLGCPHCTSPVEPWRVLGGEPFPENHYAASNEARTVRQQPPPAPAYSRDGQLLSNRSRMVAGLLGVLVGGLGIHRFYLGYTGIGLLQLILCAPTFGATWLWGFVEGILCFTGNFKDVEGRPLRD